jgi:hypothetical protein
MNILENGKVHGTGGNTFGQLGLGNKISVDTFTKIREFDDMTIERVCSGHHSGAISNQGTLFIWGTGVFGQYLTPHRVNSINVSVNDLKIGGCFGCALDSRGILWTWGSNTSGELGVGDFEPRSAPYPLVNLQEQKIQSISCGSSYAIAILQTAVEQEAIVKLRPRALKSPKPYASLPFKKTDPFSEIKGEEAAGTIQHISDVKSPREPQNRSADFPLQSESRNILDGSLLKAEPFLSQPLSKSFGSLVEKSELSPSREVIQLSLF